MADLFGPGLMWGQGSPTNGRGALIFTAMKELVQLGPTTFLYWKK